MRWENRVLMIFLVLILVNSGLLNGQKVNWVSIADYGKIEPSEKDEGTDIFIVNDLPPGGNYIVPEELGDVAPFQVESSSVNFGKGMSFFGVTGKFTRIDGGVSFTLKEVADAKFDNGGTEIEGEKLKGAKKDADKKTVHMEKVERLKIENSGEGTITIEDGTEVDTDPIKTHVEDAKKMEIKQHTDEEKEALKVVLGTEVKDVLNKDGSLKIGEGKEVKVEEPQSGDTTTIENGNEITVEDIPKKGSSKEPKVKVAEAEKIEQKDGTNGVTQTHEGVRGWENKPVNDLPKTTIIQSDKSTVNYGDDNWVQFTNTKKAEFTQKEYSTEFTTESTDPVGISLASLPNEEFEVELTDPKRSKIEVGPANDEMIGFSIHYGTLENYQGKFVVNNLDVTVIKDEEIRYDGDFGYYPTGNEIPIKAIRVKEGSLCIDTNYCTADNVLRTEPPSEATFTSICEVFAPGKNPFLPNSFFKKEKGGKVYLKVVAGESGDKIEMELIKPNDETKVASLSNNDITGAAIIEPITKEVIPDLLLITGHSSNKIVETEASTLLDFHYDEFDYHPEVLLNYENSDGFKAHFEEEFMESDNFKVYRMQE